MEELRSSAWQVPEVSAFDSWAPHQNKKRGPRTDRSEVDIPSHLVTQAATRVFFHSRAGLGTGSLLALTHPF